MAKKFDLSAAMGATPVSELDTNGAMVERLPLDKLVRNPKNFYNAREGLGDLADSIEVNGLLEPLLVRPEDGGYVIISGHRRFNALCEMKDRGVDYDYDVIDCIVDRSVMTSAQETTKLIEANRQRIKTPAEIASEAQYLTDAYVERKKRGETLPGKIRDMVAKDMELSASKLARLNVIKKGLAVPGFVNDFEAGKLPESVAYEIAKLPDNEQYRVFHLSIQRGEAVSLSLVRRYNFISDKKTRCDCVDGDVPCDIVNIIYDHFYSDGSVVNCSGCCLRCQRNDTCAYACDVCRGDAAPVSAEAKAPADGVSEAQPWLVEIFCTRLKAARKAALLDKKEIARLVGAYDGTYSSWENASLPGANWFPRLAKALGVSADYLLGLTDAPDPYAIPEGWQPLDEDHLPKRGDLVLLGYESAGAGPQYAAFFYRGGDLFEPAGPDGREIDGFGDYEFWCRVERYEPKNGGGAD